MKKLTTKMLCRAGIIAALYVALTYAFGALAYNGFLQIRPAEALTILPLFFPEAIPALYIGCMLSNIASPFWVYDVFVGSLATLAAAVGPFLGMTFHGNGSFSLLFAVCCALTGAATLAALFITRQPPSQPAAAPKTAAERGWKAFLEPKAFRVSGFAAAFYIGYSALLTYLAIYADEKGMASAGRFFFVVYALSIFVSRPVTGPLFDKKGEAAVLLPAFLAFAAGMLLLGWCPDSPVLLVSAALLGFGVGVTQSTGLAAAVKEAPPQRLAVVNSTFYIFLDVAVGLGPVLMGFILTATGNSYALLYTGLGLFSLAVTAVYFVFRPRRSF